MYMKAGTGIQLLRILTTYMYLLMHPVSYLYLITIGLMEIKIKCVREQMEIGKVIPYMEGMCKVVLTMK